MPERIGRRLLDAGHRADAGHPGLPGRDRRRRPGRGRPGGRRTPSCPCPPAGDASGGPVVTWDEVEAKAALATYGVPVPGSAVTERADELPALAAGLGFPVVLKAVAAGLAHKSEVGGVAIGLGSEDAVRRAAAGMVGPAVAGPGRRFLVERMVGGALLELLVGVQRDARLGLGLTLGAGGVLVELLDDSATLLLPTTRAEIRHALTGLRVGPVLEASAGGPPTSTRSWPRSRRSPRSRRDHADRLVELEVNPLLVLPEGAMAVDALIRLAEPVVEQE